MSRMYASKRGKSGSKKPPRTMNPAWVEISADEAIQAIEKNAKKGVGASNIGRMLRDQYGVPSVKLLTGKKLGKILDEQKVSHELPEDLTSLIKRTVEVRNHLATHKKDNRSKRGLQLMVSKINRLTKYYHRKGRIPAGWRYDAEKAKLLVQ